MRLLIVEPVGHMPGHHSYYSRRLSESLLDTGRVEQVTVLSYTGFADRWPRHDGLSLVQAVAGEHLESCAPMERPSLWRAATQAVMPEVVRLAPDHDVIQFLDCWPPTVAGWLWRWPALRRKSVYLWHYHPVEADLPRLSQLPRGLRTRLLNFRERLWPEGLLMNHVHSLVHAETVRDKMLSVYPRAQVTVIPPGSDAYDRPLPSRAEARRQLGLKLSNERALLLFGYLGPHKGLDTFLLASRDDSPPVSLLVAGPPRQDYDPARLIADAGWTDRTVLRPGYLPDEEVPLWFCAADAVLLAYPAFFIQNSGVLTRAADFLTPVIISDVGQMGQLARQYGLGVLFTPEDPASLRQAVDHFLSLGEEELAAMREGLAQFAHDHSWPLIAARHVAMYQNIIERKKE